MQSTIRAPVAPYGGPVVITSDSAPQLQIVRGDGRQRLTFAVAADGRTSIGSSAPITIAAPLQVANLQMTGGALATTTIATRAPVANDIAITPAEFGTTIRVSSATAEFTMTLPTGSAILDALASRFSASARANGTTITLRIINDTAFNATLALTLVAVTVRANVRTLAAVDTLTPCDSLGRAIILPHSTAVIVAVLIAAATPPRATFIVEGSGDAVDASAPLVTPEMFGAVGDGITDDGVALAAACAATTGLRKGKIVGRPSAKYWTASAFANPLGVRFDPAMSVYVGTQSVASRAHDQVITGQEYLYGFLAKLTSRAPTSAPLRVLFTGDSTTEGTSSDHPSVSDRVPNIFRDLCVASGIDCVLPLNYGKRGETCLDWSVTYVGPEIAAAPDAWVWRWGINDAGSHYTPTNFSTYLRNGLTAIRAAFPLSSGVSIVLMTPNTIENYDDYSEEYSDVIRQAARDFQCCFIDTYAIWNDSMNGADKWLDSMGIHPQAAFNRQMTSVIFDTMFPRMYCEAFRQSRAITLGSLSSKRATFAIPPTAAFFMSCASGAIAEYSANGSRVIGQLTGNVTDTGGYITIVPTPPTMDINMIVSRALFTTGPALDGGSQGCIRFKYTPMYTGYPTYYPDGMHAMYIFETGYFNFNQWQNVSGSLISIQHYNGATPNGKFWVNVRNTDGTNAYNSTTGLAWSAISGQEYDFEIDWNFAGGNRRFSLFIDGVATVALTTVTCNRTAVPMLGFGDHFYRVTGSETFKIRDLEMYTTEQHTVGPFTPAQITSTVVDYSGVIVPAVPPTASHAVPRSYADAIAPVTIPGAVTLTGSATSVAVQLYILNTSGLITCHFSTRSAAPLSGEVVASLANATAIPDGSRPSAAYGTATHAFPLGTAIYTVSVTIAGSFTITRAPAWGIGDDLNFASTITYYNA
jgi:lysophospholipase L1-like esterase